MTPRDRSTWPAWAKALTTGWVISPLLVIALAAATFEGYGYYTRHQTTTYSRGGAFGTDASFKSSASKDAGRRAQPGASASHARHHQSRSSGSHITNGGTHVTTLGTAPGHSTKAKPATKTGEPATSPTHQASHASSTSSPTSTTNTSAPLITPKAGAYTLSVQGHENAKFGPISPCNNAFPTRSTLVVHHAAGESKTSYDFDWRLYPNQANRHDERHIYSYSRHSVDLTFEQETVTCAGIKQSTAVDYSPAQLRVSLPLTVGSTWHNHGGGSARTETGFSTVAKRTSLRVDGHSYPVYVIDTKLALAGSETGERDQTWWYSPQLAMPLKWSESLDGRRSGASYSESYTATVVGMP